MLESCHFGGIRGREIGEGPLAIVLHGWGGRTAQMVPIARTLADEGYHAVVPELPGHAGGLRTDIKEVAEALRSVVDELGEPEVVVGHSFAALVLRVAYPDNAPPRVFLVAPVVDATDALSVFGERLRLFPWARRGLRRRLEVWDTSLWPMVSQVQPGQLKGSEFFVVHDPLDRESPFARAAELAARRPRTSIAAVEGAGHSRILSDPVTLGHLAAFVSDEATEAHSAA